MGNAQRPETETDGPVLPTHRKHAVKMYMVTLKPDFCGHEKCTFKESEDMSRRYQQFLRSANIQVKPYCTGIGSLLFVDSDAHFVEVHEFLMAQPEVYRLTVGGQKFYPPGTVLDQNIERPPDPMARRKVKSKRAKSERAKRIRRRREKRRRGRRRKGRRRKTRRARIRKSKKPNPNCDGCDECRTPGQCK